jgi:CBS domain-containing protein
MQVRILFPIAMMGIKSRSGFIGSYRKKGIMKARDVMTKELTNCSPQASVAKAAKLMRDRNTGDVLVTDEGRLVGILTDRDIAIRVTAKASDPGQVLVGDVMSKQVRTGGPSWDLTRVAQEMGRHQIRRLPIAEYGVPVGMISLSDIALHNNHKSQVAKSLRDISESTTTHRLYPVKRGLLFATLGMGLATAAVVAVNMFPGSGRKLWERIQTKRIGERLLAAAQTGREIMSAAWDRN